MPGVPIYTATTTGSTEGAPRGTVEQTYKRITDDLEEAVGLLTGFNRNDRKHVVNQRVAQGILAEVYLTMNRWHDAATVAAEARAGFPLMDTLQFVTGFNDITNPEWMWGMEQTAEQNMSDYSPFSMWRGPRICPSFDNFMLSQDFVEKFEKNDVRSQFHHLFPALPAPFNQRFSTFKFIDTEVCRGSIVFMRSASMFLIEAEALARDTGRSDGEARAVLNQLQSKRRASLTQTSGQQLIDDILIERRKELYGEGYIWFDMIRNQQPLDRRNIRGHHSKHYFPAHSWRFIYQIPIHEMGNNINMRQGDWPLGCQNPFDGVYVPNN
jgi:hypothetical protein